LDRHAVIELIAARTAEPLAIARELFREYAASLEIDLEYQGFAAEVAGLPGEYAPPRGELLLAYVEGEVAGCVALRPLRDDIGEMKRLYVRPQQRGSGIGRKLVEAIIEAARTAKYCELRLDTLATMDRAQRLYRELGFTEIAPYYAGYPAGTRFYALRLEEREG
jgi:putative acetyltransferase